MDFKQQKAAELQELINGFNAGTCDSDEFLKGTRKIVKTLENHLEEEKIGGLPPIFSWDGMNEFLRNGGDERYPIPAQKFWVSGKKGPVKNPRADQRYSCDQIRTIYLVVSEQVEFPPDGVSGYVKIGIEVDPGVEESYRYNGNHHVTDYFTPDKVWNGIADLNEIKRLFDLTFWTAIKSGSIKVFFNEKEIDPDDEHAWYEFGKDYHT